VALVLLFELILVRALLLLGGLLMRLSLVAGSHVRTDEPLSFRDGPSSFPKDLTSGYRPKARLRNVKRTTACASSDHQ